MRHVPRRPRPAQLLGPDGSPIQIAEQIPFIQWLPNGQTAGRFVDRGETINAQAARFLAKGGRYSFILRADNMAEIVAGFPLDDGAKGEMALVAEEVVADGPEVGPAIDRLIANSVANMDRFTVTTETMQ